MPNPEYFRRVAYRLYQLLWYGLDWIYPPVCGGCGTPGTRWCLKCASEIEKIDRFTCIRCGRVLLNPGLCIRCQKEPPSYTTMKSWAVFSGPLRHAIHRLKYEGDIALGEILSRPLISWVNSFNWEIDAVVPVPIGIARRAERGYNQAAIIGLPLAFGLGKAYCPKWLVKVRETRSQVGLSLKERQENIKDAFSAPDNGATGKRVLIIDDVTTSGATMEACSSALLKSGAREVFGITLARSNVRDSNLLI